MQKNAKVWNLVRHELVSSWDFLADIATRTNYSLPGVTYVARSLGVDLKLRRKACYEHQRSLRLFEEAEQAKANASRLFRHSIRNIDDEIFEEE
jgi:hypothetical protein